MDKNYCPIHAQLILDDNYIEEVRDYFLAASIDAENKLQILISSLETASNDGVINGKTADALKQFMERVSILSGQIQEYGTTCSKFAQEFFEVIDEVDKDLYK